MATIQELDEARNNVFNTPSEKAEYNENSVQTIIDQTRDLLQARGVIYVDNVDEMQAISGSEGNMCVVRSAGVFAFMAADIVGLPAVDNIQVYEAAAASGVWVLVANIGQDVQVNKLQDLEDADIDTPKVGQTIVWEGTKWANRSNWNIKELDTATTYVVTPNDNTLLLNDGAGTFDIILSNTQQLHTGQVITIRNIAADNIFVKVGGTAMLDGTTVEYEMLATSIIVHFDGANFWTIARF